MSGKALQRIDDEGNAHTIAEFHLVGAGIRATYATTTLRREMEVDGIWTTKTGTLYPSDGQAFLDALPKAFAASSRVRVVDLDAKPRTDDDYTPPPPQGSFRPAPETTPPGKPANPDPNTAPKPIIMADDAESVEHDDTWSDEARAAALEARQASAKAKSEGTADSHRAAAAAHMKAARVVTGKEKQKQAAAATAHAAAATKVAAQSGKMADHQAAAKAHSSASGAQTAAGNKELAQKHAESIGMHTREAAKASPLSKISEGAKQENVFTKAMKEPEKKPEPKAAEKPAAKAEEKPAEKAKAPDNVFTRAIAQAKALKEHAEKAPPEHKEAAEEVKKAAAKMHEHASKGAEHAEHAEAAEGEHEKKEHTEKAHGHESKLAAVMKGLRERANKPRETPGVWGKVKGAGGEHGEKKGKAEHKTKGEHKGKGEHGEHEKPEHEGKEAGGSWFHDLYEILKGKEKR